MSESTEYIDNFLDTFKEGIPEKERITLKRKLSDLTYPFYEQHQQVLKKKKKERKTQLCSQMKQKLLKYIKHGKDKVILSIDIPFESPTVNTVIPSNTDGIFTVHCIIQDKSTGVVLDIECAEYYSITKNGIEYDYDNFFYKFDVAFNQDIIFKTLNRLIDLYQFIYFDFFSLFDTDQLCISEIYSKSKNKIFEIVATNMIYSIENQPLCSAEITGDFIDLNTSRISLKRKTISESYSIVYNDSKFEKQKFSKLARRLINLK